MKSFTLQFDRTRRTGSEHHAHCHPRRCGANSSASTGRSAFNQQTFVWNWRWESVLLFVSGDLNLPLPPWPNLLNGSLRVGMPRCLAGQLLSTGADEIASSIYVLPVVPTTSAHRRSTGSENADWLISLLSRSGA